MNIQTRNFFLKILHKSDSPQMQQVLFNILAAKKDDDLLDSDKLFLNPPLILNENDEEDNVVKDFRVKWITLQNFRSIPNVEGEPYGIRFTDSTKHPQSLFLVGRNGTGKTTIFSALEHHYLSSSSLSSEMGVEALNILTFGFRRIQGNEPLDVYINVQTIDGVSKEESLYGHPPVCSPASFCSEYDLIEMSRKGGNLFHYLLAQLGYDELAIYKKKIEKVRSEIRDILTAKVESGVSDLRSKDVAEVVKTFLTLYESFQKNKESMQLKNLQQQEAAGDVKIQVDYYDEHHRFFEQGNIPDLFSEYWRQLREISNVTIAPVNPVRQRAAYRRSEDKKRETVENETAISQKIKNLYSLLEQMLREYSANSTIEKLSEILEAMTRKRTQLMANEGQTLPGEEERNMLGQREKTLTSLIEAIDRERLNIVEKFCEEHFEMIKKILSFFSDQDGQLYISSLSDGQLTISMKDPKVGKGLFEATPQEYYNSFRYRLYAVSFKIALALLNMRLKNIRVPIVIDDVFNASDFENNQRLENFVYSIYNAYDSLGFDEPLQLIMLTHDEMVLTAFKKGTEAAGNSYLSGRLFPYYWARQMHNDIYGTPLERDGFYNLYMPY